MESLYLCYLQTVCHLPPKCPKVILYLGLLFFSTQPVRLCWTRQVRFAKLDWSSIVWCTSIAEELKSIAPFESFRSIRLISGVNVFSSPFQHIKRPAHKEHLITKVLPQNLKAYPLAPAHKGQTREQRKQIHAKQKQDLAIFVEQQHLRLEPWEGRSPPRKTG